MTTVVKTTSKGQVTLPAKWRRNFETNRFLIKEKGDTLIISPIRIESLEETGEWETIFDAKRDNRGRSIPLAKFISKLKKTL